MRCLKNLPFVLLQPNEANLKTWDKEAWQRVGLYIARV